MSLSRTTRPSGRPSPLPTRPWTSVGKRPSPRRRLNVDFQLSRFSPFSPFNDRRIEHTRDCTSTIPNTGHRSFSTFRMFSSFRKFSIFLSFPHPQSLVCARMLVFVSSVFSLWTWFISLMISMPQGLSHVFAESFSYTHIAFRESSNPQNHHTAFHSLLTTGVWSGNPHREGPRPKGGSTRAKLRSSVYYSENCIDRCIFPIGPPRELL